MDFYKEYLNYEGVVIEVEVDHDTHVLLQNEQNRQQYAQQVYYQVIRSQNAENQVVASCSMQPNIESCTQPVVASGSNMQKFNIYDDTKTPAIHQEHESTHSNVKWDDKIIRCLLAVRLGKEAAFIKPHCKKIRLWKDVAANVSEISKQHVTAEACDTKYRNLLATYRKNKLKQHSTGEGQITWEYFDLMDSVLGSKASSCPPKETLLDSLSPDLENKEDEVVTEEDEPQKKNKKLKRVTKKQEMSLQMYLFEKNRREEVKEEERKKQEEIKEKKKDEQWLEQKALKEKEIEAILTLAKAIADKK